MANLFDEFSIVSGEEWLKQAEKEIGKTGSLFSTSLEGITTKPIYSHEDLKLIREKGFQNNFSNKGTWFYIDEIELVREEMANIEAIESLKGGSDGICFILKKESIDFEILLKDIWVDNCIIGFEDLNDNPSWISDFLLYYQRNYTNPSSLRGWIHLAYNKEGGEMFRILNSNAGVSTFSFPNLYVSMVDAASFTSYGSDVIREIAYTLSIGVDRIEMLKKAGYSSERALSSTLLSITVGTNFFFEISKLRAIRLLWSNLAGAYGVKIPLNEVQILAKNSTWHKSALDSENNIIRDGAEAMAAVIGGCNFLTLRQNNAKTEQPIDYKRIARNLSHILKEESFLDKVKDPAGGAFYIEHLTNEIVQRSWRQFLKIEEVGGFDKSYKEGFIKEEIEKRKSEQYEDVDLRRKISIGSNFYPNLKEVLAGKELPSTEHATYKIERLRAWVEDNLPKQSKVLIGIWETSMEQREIELLKQTFNSVGLMVSTTSDLNSSLSKKDIIQFVLTLCITDSDKISQQELSRITEMSGRNLLFISTDRNKKLDLPNSLTLEELVRSETLGKVLENIKINSL